MTRPIEEQLPVDVSASESEKPIEPCDPSVAAALAEHEALLDSLREANGHLVLANLRSQSLAEQMNQLYEEARAAIQAKDDFFSAISHELRTPLTSIAGWAALLLQTSRDAAIVAEAARSIASSAADQALLIDDLLDVSRIMTHKFAISEMPIDLREVIADSVSGMRPIAAAKDIALTETAEESIVISGDAARLRQVLTNLLTNAIKFTPVGGSVVTSLSRDGTCATIDVCDNGEGISAAFLPFVFDRRAQATERRFAGLGLGLAIVKHIVELHRGTVAVHSEGEGKGATFTVRIPCAA
ncbi:MAG TPA: HAMP domain-containing sensor histidine kinase [Thermoanaerobaculia bacterium]|jgi:signal transduction histidine kinase|nr:HAMP domain-containing sensor histidine kinase [Thermoanaerobaculia bacterium]